MTPPLENSAFTYGFNGDFLKTVGDYWLKKYDWNKSGGKKLEAMGKHFKTRIDGIDLHFIHAKPDSKAAKGKTVLPLLIVHGWPGKMRKFEIGHFTLRKAHTETE